MSSSTKPPYPTVVEVIRTITNALDIKHGNKKLDNLAKKTDVYYYEIDSLLIESFIKPLKKYFDETTVSLFARCFAQFLEAYISMVNTLSLAPLSREEAIEFLAESRFAMDAAAIINLITDELEPSPHPVTFVSHDENAVHNVLQWLLDNESGWSEFVKNCPKEKKDLLARWKKGQELPSSQSIFILHEWIKEEHDFNWNKIRILLLLARAVDWFRKKEVGIKGIEATRLYLFNSQSTREKITHQLSNLIEYSKTKYSNLWQADENITQAFSNEEHKNRQEYIKNELSNAYELLKSDSTMAYLFDWHQAKYYLFSGNLVKACQYYKKAFEGCLYRAGEEQEWIIEEALVIAANQKNPDRSFLKRLYSMAVFLGYDMPVTESATSTKDIIEDWQIALWHGEFKNKFPDTAFFEGVTVKQKTTRNGFIFFDPEKDFKPDYKNPNRKIKVGLNSQKRLPQLVWFAEHEKIDVVEKLLKKGASVNVYSDAGDTPLLMALRKLDVTEPVPIFHPSLDDHLFKLIIQHEHTTETVNKRTAKKRYLPIISAVESARLDVVETVLKMGADPNKLGTVDNRTALYSCLLIIAMVKNFHNFWAKIANSPITPKHLDTARRYTNGTAGVTLEELARRFSNKNERLWQTILDVSKTETEKRVKKYISLDTMRAIGIALLKAGANPNVEYIVPGVEKFIYTPLMLAAELNEKQLFKAMLEHGADPKKYYVNPFSGEKFNSWTIAIKYQSDDVLQLAKEMGIDMVGVEILGQVT